MGARKAEVNKAWHVRSHRTHETGKDCHQGDGREVGGGASGMVVFWFRSIETKKTA